MLLYSLIMPFCTDGIVSLHQWLESLLSPIWYVGYSSTFVDLVENQQIYCALALHLAQCHFYRCF